MLLPEDDMHRRTWGLVLVFLLVLCVGGGFGFGVCVWVFLCGVVWLGGLFLVLCVGVWLWVLSVLVCGGGLVPSSVVSLCLLFCFCCGVCFFWGVLIGLGLLCVFWSFVFCF